MTVDERLNNIEVQLASLQKKMQEFEIAFSGITNEQSKIISECRKENFEVADRLRGELQQGIEGVMMAVSHVSQMNDGG